MVLVSGGPYTVTYDASPGAKVKAGGSHAINRDRHLGRAPDLASGFDFGHRNTNIDPSRSGMNESFVNDGRGGFRALVLTQDGRGQDRPPSAELRDYRETRLGQVVKPLRKDAVITRGVMLQLDPKWFEDHCPDWRTTGLDDEARRLIQVQLEWACQEFGQENIVGGSIDLDETSPHLQLSIVPVTRDGRLSQKDFFRGPGHFKKQRADLCDALENAGYEPQRTVTSRSTERTSSAEYARTVQKATATLAVARRDGTKLWDERQELKAKQAELNKVEQSLSDARHEVETELADVPRLRRKAVEKGKADGHRQGYDAGWAAAQARIPAEVEREVSLELQPARDDLRRRLEELERERAELAAMRSACANAAARFDALSQNLQPLVDRWEQLNPHTDKGRNARRSLEAVEKVRHAAKQIHQSIPTSDVPDDGFEPEL